MFDDDDLGDEFHDHLSPAMAVGTGYALYRHGQDRQVEQLAHLLDQRTAEVIEVGEPVPPTNTRVVEPGALDWNSFTGQEQLKHQLKVYIDAALKRGDRLPHILLASGFPGVGKTMLSRIIAKMMDAPMVELMPPFDTYTLVDAAKRLPDKGILFVDEIHKLADSGKRGAEILLKVLEEGIAFLPDGTMVQLPDITIIGATTDRDKLPEPVVDRFKVKPAFAPYTLSELAQIAVRFSYRHWCEDTLDDDKAISIGLACRSTPRVAEEFVLGNRDLTLHLGRDATIDEMLTFMDVTEDGLTAAHRTYLTALYQFFGQDTADGVKYVAGEAAIKQMLRETNNGLQRIETFLLERGFIDRTPRGRQLTDLGVERVQELIA